MEFARDVDVLAVDAGAAEITATPDLARTAVSSWVMAASLPTIILEGDLWAIPAKRRLSWRGANHKDRVAVPRVG
jgi:hypothetical protein